MDSCLPPRQVSPKIPHPHPSSNNLPDPLRHQTTSFTNLKIEPDSISKTDINPITQPPTLQHLTKASTAKMQISITSQRGTELVSITTPKTSCKHQDPATSVTACCLTQAGPPYQTAPTPLPGLAVPGTHHPLRMHPVPGPRATRPRYDDVSWTVDFPGGEEWILPYGRSKTFKCKFGRAMRWVERKVVKGVPPL